MGILHHILADAGPELKIKPLVVLHLVLIDQTSEEHSGEEGDDDTDDPGGSEAADRTCTVTRRMTPVINEVRLESKIAEKALA